MKKTLQHFNLQQQGREREGGGGGDGGRNVVSLFQLHLPRLISNPCLTHTKSNAMQASSQSIHKKSLTSFTWQSQQRLTWAGLRVLIASKCSTKNWTASKETRLLRKVKESPQPGQTSILFWLLSANDTHPTHFPIKNISTQYDPPPPPPPPPLSLSLFLSPGSRCCGALHLESVARLVWSWAMIQVLARPLRTIPFGYQWSTSMPSTSHGKTVKTQKWRENIEDNKSGDSLRKERRDAVNIASQRAREREREREREKRERERERERETKNLLPTPPPGVQRQSNASKQQQWSSSQP